MKGTLMKPWKTQFIAEHPDIEIQTRRVIKPQPLDSYLPDSDIIKRLKALPKHTIKLQDKDDPSFNHIIPKPRYQVGETAYIKEKALYWDGGAGGRSNMVYADDPEIPQLLEDNNRLLVARETANIEAGESVVGKWQWKSPIFMPAEDARYFIKILAVRAERLQEISGADALAEGVEPCKYKGYTKSYAENDYMVGHFATLWNSINKEKWEANPWVWVYTFKSGNP